MATIQDIYQLYLQHPLISTDTRSIAPGSLFFALKGDKFDANTFAEKAIEAGAAYAVVDNRQYALNDHYVLVDDVLTTLQNLARHHRMQLNIPVIGLTGTNGKTTTKELINAVLSQRYNTLATQGNLNNHIGVPLTLLKLTAGHEMAVIEMGANHQREIALLCHIAQPTHGLITNVGKAHLEGFGGVEGVRKGKGEMYDYLNLSANPEYSAAEHGAVAFINSNDAVLLQMQQERGLKNAIYYGKTDHGDNLITGKLIENSPLLFLEWKDNLKEGIYTVPTQLTGSYNLDNILVAICIGATFGLSPEEISDGIAGYEPKNNRSQLLHTAGNTLICDFYNANPSSMFVAIDNVVQMQAKKKVLILGDMFEMGDEAAAEHAAVLQKAMEAPVDGRIFIGKEFAALANGYEGDANRFYITAGEVMEALKTNPITGSTVLIKGSRGMALERLVSLF